MQAQASDGAHSSTTQSGFQYADGRWHQVAYLSTGLLPLPATGMEFFLYVDGILVDWELQDEMDNNVGRAGADAFLGGDYAGHDRFTGSLAQFAIYTHQLSGTEVRAHYDTAGLGCAAIAGATDQTYTPTTSDLGHRLAVAVTATNASGSTGQTSSETDSVYAQPPEPTRR